ncbi:hypothetical protein E2C01_088342 [Portunus trituberculatus]|uniref:Uncharacterized protein n=1 Tax=Portunus trituberculatus TaxID=210409 RepID=A0A5B7JE79_PORTR|nr:hypothetical protein [Portunus trituberculatus]
MGSYDANATLLLLHRPCDVQTLTRRHPRKVPDNGVKARRKSCLSPDGVKKRVARNREREEEERRRGGKERGYGDYSYSSRPCRCPVIHE